MGRANFFLVEVIFCTLHKLLIVMKCRKMRWAPCTAYIGRLYGSVERKAT
jgi:hypothetical protein